ncbi:MAG: hypothetical protein ACTSRS_03510 [Candidatus Helarchaeota archaeon]
MADRMVKACHKCRVYISIGNTYELVQKEKQFDREHRGHPTQVVRISEVKEYYKPADGD